MLDLLKIRLSQGTRTIAFPPPAGASGLAPRFRGLPVLDPAACKAGCTLCADACPTDAIRVEGGLALDLGRCTFCVECTRVCPEGAVRFGGDYRLAASRREDLVLTGGEPKLARALDDRMRRLFGRSLKLRQVSAGGCNGCEAELVAAGNVIFDLGRFGVQFVASPRHADGIVVTGPPSNNMRAALEATYAAVPAPKIVIAVGACAISGGPFFDSPLVTPGVGSVLPVDLFIPGCPPHPLTILDGMLRLLGKIEDEKRAPLSG
jgi:Ni,Fe-hydrogenase III small subunit/formate hydrogenlyase subunit 6/NADH:ubiquinone oxidoreductase subunit I